MITLNSSDVLKMLMYRIEKFDADGCGGFEKITYDFLKELQVMGIEVIADKMFYKKGE